VIPTLHLIHGWRCAPIREPRSHVVAIRPTPARPFDWLQDDPDMAVEDDATPAHGIQRTVA
jgi:hypothetical protein